MAKNKNKKLQREKIIYKHVNGWTCPTSSPRKEQQNLQTQTPPPPT